MDNIYYGHMFGWGWGGFLGSLLLWIIGILFLLWLIKQVIRKELRTDKLPTVAPRNSALEILKERYARGEITKKEFESKRADLES